MRLRKIQYPLAAILVFSLLLLGVNIFLRDARASNAENDRLERMKRLLPGSESFEKIENTNGDTQIRNIYQGEGGYVIETEVEGYAAPISMRFGVDESGRITGLQVMEMHETPGLGAKALSDLEFLKQFINKRGELRVRENVDVVSGATVTCKAVARGFNSASAYVTGADASSGATSWGG